ncbi:hypothetical protein [Azospirillum rugosum]|uniref:DUF2892 domain-containing protein n=1 Tax=Azospirillum rugosum TaxID=416170 RepID=A0ABS4SL75_9PROT|nr:hypothetical protein [Azospirillum rugosum]MBP2293324.1 hypothetical protein [Azospirillum rugosum]
MLPATASRVENATSNAVNRRIAAGIEASVRHHAGHPEQIGRRLDDLDREWDVERTLEANAATLALTGTLLGAFVDRRFLVLPALVTGFLLQHALQGWCPPVPILRRLGVRTATEIERERTALKALRGDFKSLDGTAPEESAAKRACQALAAANA